MNQSRVLSYSYICRIQGFESKPKYKCIPSSDVIIKKYIFEISGSDTTLHGFLELQTIKIYNLEPKFQKDRMFRFQASLNF